MTQESKEVLINRAKSLAWRVGMMLSAELIGFALANLSLLNLNQSMTTLLGLVLGEVSKWINSYLQTKVA